MSAEQRQALDAAMRAMPLDLGGDVDQQRVVLDQMMTMHPLPADVHTHVGEVAGVPVVNISVGADAASAVILYLHGGAYALGSAGAAAGLAADIARRANARAVSVEYRLAPDHPYPAGLEDVVAAYCGLLATGVPSSSIAIAGESAGAGLAAAALLAVKDAGLPRPAGAVLLSPWVDLTLTGESLLTRARLDPAVTEQALRTRAADYLAGADPTDRLVSPALADLAGLPPLLIQVGSNEVLLDDAIRLATHAARADVEVTLEVIPGVPHVFQSFASILDEGLAALDRVGTFLRRHLTTTWTNDFDADHSPVQER